MDKRIGSVSLQMPSGCPLCSPSECHPVAEGQLASMEWLASGGPLEGRWCYVFRVTNNRRLQSFHRHAGQFLKLQIVSTFLYIML